MNGVGQMFYNREWLDVGKHFAKFRILCCCVACAGTIPTELGRLSKLEVLDVGHNSLNGEFVGLIFRTKLHGRSFSVNMCPALLLRAGGLNPTLGSADLFYYFERGIELRTGPIPQELGDLQALTILILESSELTGELC